MKLWDYFRGKMQHWFKSWKLKAAMNPKTKIGTCDVNKISIIMVGVETGKNRSRDQERRFEKTGCGRRAQNAYRHQARVEWSGVHPKRSFLCSRLPGWPWTNHLTSSASSSSSTKWKYWTRWSATFSNLWIRLFMETRESARVRGWGNKRIVFPVGYVELEI